MPLSFALVIVFNFMFAELALAQEHKDFCAKVSQWPAGQEVPPAQEYSVLAHELVDAKKASEIVKDAKVVFIDARSEEDRKAGQIPHTIYLVSDPKNPKKHQFSDEKLIVEKLNKKLKTNFSKVTDFKDYRIVIFCNGTKCHRSTFAACTLRDFGFPKSNIALMLGGFGEWKNAGLPVK